MVTSPDRPRVELSDVEFHAGDIDLIRAKRTYDEVGFVVVRGLLRAHMDPMLEEVERAVARAHVELEGAEHARYGWLTKSGAVFTDRSLDIESEPTRRQLIVAGLDQNSSPTMNACARDPRMLTLVTAMLGGSPHPIGAGQCMYKEARGTAMGLHQDAVYTAISGYNDVVTTFAYVVPTSIERGSIWLIPYSQTFDVLSHHETGPHTGCIREELCSWDDAIALPGDAGDAVFWHWKTIHGSKPNFTDAPRPALVARYGLAAEAKLMAERGLGQW